MGGIIWIASYPKSGNTWMRAFLHNLLLDPPEPARINELTQFTLGDTHPAWYEKVAGAPVHGASHAELARLRPLVHRLFTQVYPDSVFVKTHMALTEIAGTPLITMDYTAGAIYIVRDPRDVAISSASHFGTDIDGAIEMMANAQARTDFNPGNVPQYYGTWSQHVQSWTALPHRALLIVRYEDMLTKPGPTFRKVAEFLNLKPPPERLQKAIRFSSFGEMKKQEEKEGFIERSDLSSAFFRTGKAGQWRDRLTPAQIEKIVAAHGDVMRKFHYLKA